MAKKDEATVEEKPDADAAGTTANRLEFKAANKPSARSHIDALELSDEHKRTLKDAVTASDEIEGHVVHVLGDLNEGELGEFVVTSVPRDAA